MPLDEYRKKRDFARTPEPAGRSRPRRDRRFVVQKHAATRLHYDFRLEVDGTLASWAVPRGPSMNPADKRLAVRTEDHPLEYADFEGIIPPGQYGAGSVVLWDRGTYDLGESVPMAHQLSRGKIAVLLNGRRLRGRFVLIRTRSGPGGARQESWLLIKQRDEHADPGWRIEGAEGSTDPGPSRRNPRPR